MSQGAAIAAIAASVLLTASGIPAAHAEAVTTYGVGLRPCQTYLNALNSDNVSERVTFVDWLSGYVSADKTCGQYLEARGGRESINGAEFRDWLAGYLSGVNAISLANANVLGNSELLDAIHWLDGWCASNPLASYSSAAAALVSAREGESRAAVRLATH